MAKYPEGFKKLNIFVNDILKSQPNAPRKVPFGGLFKQFAINATTNYNPISALFNTLKHKSALEKGVPGTCKIQEAKHNVGYGGSTVVRDVKAGDRSFTDKTPILQTWQREVEKGMELKVLVHPTEDKVILELGKGEFIY